MQTFRLRRRVDHSGVSGTGVVAEGVIFGKGHVALSWVVAPEGFEQVPLGVAVYESAHHVTAVHGHGGDTWIEFLDCADCQDPVSGGGHLYCSDCEAVFCSDCRDRHREAHPHI